MRVSERTIINKIYAGIGENGWELHNGLGTGQWNGAATDKSMVAPLIEYLKKKGIEVN